MGVKNGSASIVAAAQLVDKVPGMVEKRNELDVGLPAILIDGLLKIISFQPMDGECYGWKAAS